MRFVIVTLPYRRNSGGIRALYELQKKLILAGEDAITTILPFDLDKDDVVILPEITPNGYYNTDRIIRWFLAPKLDTIDYSDAKLKVAWRKDFAEDCDLVLRVPIIESFFKNNNLKREYTAGYIGKGEYFTHSDVPETALHITPEWPPTREDLADFLNRCSDVYIFDDMSALGYEARLCGCNTWLVKDGKIIEYHQTTDFSESEDQLKNFIATAKEVFSENNQAT